ncbi:hypothetical protein [Pantoea agglomerans]|uniref:hypothetical protein n=1 Tax=Enterobacter agglomerans TaxID=549 RepID=UPI0024132A12|nr:hypothetical protein [Pantoea agglomerans]
MNHPFDISVKTIVMNSLALLPVMAYFHLHIWPASWTGVYFAGACMSPWIMMPLQFVVSEALTERFPFLRHCASMAVLALLLACINGLFSWQVCLSLWAS